ncbi:unnamed protein product [Soboliphyme baturini]|uniref:Pseudouridylate synthase RPUSD4, mitochondrial n=1 Tax=Soboliphyme baturini TaxID=241478 RepID=A0A183II91_9BILA|nr:unnamed protein product [Soboliphyme baturini]
MHSRHDAADDTLVERLFTDEGDQVCSGSETISSSLAGNVDIMPNNSATVEGDHSFHLQTPNTYTEDCQDPRLTATAARPTETDEAIDSDVSVGTDDHQGESDAIGFIPAEDGDFSRSDQFMATENNQNFIPDMSALGQTEDSGEDSDQEAAAPNAPIFDGSSEKIEKIRSFLPRIYRMTKDEVVTLLLENILYNQNDIIAINKPYGLPAFYSKDMPFCVLSLLPLLRPFLAPKCDFLRLIHRLDQQATGVLLLASDFNYVKNVDSRNDWGEVYRSETRASEISGLMRERKVVKTYVCITKAVPNPKSGIIRIPLAEREVSNRFKVYCANLKSSYDAKFLGIKHQIRCHLGYGINCPIMGDHKYSSFLRHIPQRLSSVTLQRLGIRASKARHMPMLLHASKVRKMLFPVILLYAWFSCLDRNTKNQPWR